MITALQKPPRLTFYLFCCILSTREVATNRFKKQLAKIVLYTSTHRAMMEVLTLDDIFLIMVPRESQLKDVKRASFYQPLFSSPHERNKKEGIESASETIVGLL